MKGYSSTGDMDALRCGEGKVDLLAVTAPSPKPASAPRHIIRSVRLAHCKRGPDACEECRELDAEMICLLDLYAPGEGDVQRRMIEVVCQGKQAWYEYDILRTFDTRMEAMMFAEEHGIEDVSFETTAA
jgi:hypothetical protein